jgi:hypothetical protein
MIDKPYLIFLYLTEPYFSQFAHSIPALRLYSAHPLALPLAFPLAAYGLLKISLCGSGIGHSIKSLWLERPRGKKVATN